MNLILAADEKWGIGKDGGLLCHLPGDLKYFKEQTLGKVCVMGRKTLESLPGGKGLPKRTNIVLTRNKDFVAENATVVHSEEELFELISKYDEDQVMLIGGGQLYNHLLPKCRVCYITKIYGDFGAEVFFHNLDEDNEFVGKALGPVNEEKGIRYQFYEYRRRD